MFYDLDFIFPFGALVILAISVLTHLGWAIITLFLVLRATRYYWKQPLYLGGFFGAFNTALVRLDPNLVKWNEGMYHMIHAARPRPQQGIAEQPRITALKIKEVVEAITTGLTYHRSIG